MSLLISSCANIHRRAINWPAFCHFVIQSENVKRFKVHGRRCDGDSICNPSKMSVLPMVPSACVRVSKTKQRGHTPDGARHSREPTRTRILLLTMAGNQAPPITTSIKLLACALAHQHLTWEGQFPQYFAPLNFIWNRWSLLHSRSGEWQLQESVYQRSEIFGNVMEQGKSIYATLKSWQLGREISTKTYESSLRKEGD